jgi:hypothetical protein
VELQPVFIMGPHRSGTTILYQLLAATGCFNVTTVFHLLNRDDLLDFHSNPAAGQARRDELVRILESRGISTRKYDSVEVSPDLPEEYCFALRPQGRRPMLTPRNLADFVQFARNVQLIQDPTRPLLLKNPYDLPNFLYLRQAFPAARFIFVHRNPVQVINSQIIAIRSILEARNEYELLMVERLRKLYESPIRLALARALYRGPLPLSYWQVSRNIAACCDYVLAHLGELGDSAISITYSELCREPNGKISEILKFLGATDRSGQDYSTRIQSRNQPLLPIVEGRKEAIERRNRSYCRFFEV